MTPASGSRVRRSVLAALSLAALLPEFAPAMFLRMTDDELLASSDLVVLGEWQGQAPATDGGRPLGRDVGVVRIERVLKGRRAATIVMVVVPGAEAPRSGSDVRFTPGDTGLWFLRKVEFANRDVFAADHPQRFLPARTEAAAIERWRRRLAP
ncbi:MAG: hypothetical protein U1E86_12385 [Burkholderiaceae bacterium]